MTLDDVWGCGNATVNQFDLLIGSGETLGLRAVPDPVSIQPSTGQWGSRPSLALGVLDETLDVTSFSAFAGFEGQYWSVSADLECGPVEELTYPTEWDDLSVGDSTYASTTIGTNDSSLHCSNFGEVQPL